MLFTATVTAVALLTAASASAQALEITRAGARAIRQAPAETFTGAARVEMLFNAVDPSHASGGIVVFEPGARTAWHSHPRGQILMITEGTGRVQRWGDPVEEVRAGDVVKIPAGQKHWHGASPRASMTHIAISEHRDGSTVQWMEHVSDQQYNGLPAASSAPQPPSTRPQTGSGRPSGPLQQKVAPGMASLTDDVLYGDVWRRPDLSPRDRSLVTITALIAMGRTAPLAGHLGRALDNGLQPGEASGLLAHMAVYCGWPNAVAALDAYDQVYTARKIDTDALRSTSPRLPAGPSGTAEATGALAAVAPKFAQLTSEWVFGDLWRRSDLSARDRHLVTIVALAATGDHEQLDAYVRRGLESGLTRAQIVEAVTHLGFYAGWPRATAAMTVVATSFGK